MEDVPEIRRSPSLATNREGCLHERLLRQSAEKRNGVEQVRLADSVSPRDAGEWAERHVEIDEVLESVDFETCQHGPPGDFPCRVYRSPAGLARSLLPILAGSGNPGYDDTVLSGENCRRIHHEMPYPRLHRRAPDPADQPLGDLPGADDRFSRRAGRGLPRVRRGRADRGDHRPAPRPAAAQGAGYGDETLGVR